MSKDIQKLEPQLLWECFYQLTQVPRPSKKEEKIRSFMMNFGEKLGLETEKDKAGNILIRKPATPGMENRKTVVLQGHLDMVPQANSSSVHDFENDPIDVYIDGEWVKANGTTLGADNGIGVAAAMALLASTDLEHGPVEALFTADEETGMTGAFGIRTGWLKGGILLNLDSEEEGELCVGCAGGIDVNINFTYTEVNVPEGVKAFYVALTGLKGGHSGIDIHKGKGNANKLMFRFLKKAVRSFGLRLASIEGGNLRNAIPREAFATVVVPEANVEDVKELAQKYESVFKDELSMVEPDIQFVMGETEMPGSLIEEMVQDDLINGIYGCPNGVIRMSDTMPGVTETSNNLASVHSENGEIYVNCLVRSSVDSAKEDVCEQIESVFRLADAEVKLSGAYPGWKPNPESEILKLMKKVYNQNFGRVPEVKAIHAGLECGLLGAVYPNWDMISFGPTIRYPHSPDEQVEIASVKKFWEFLLAVLKEIPEI